MKLYIAEKPSLGRAIVAALPRPHHREKGYYRLGNGDVVSWCIGHLLELAQPQAYDARYKQWRLEDLPILPQQQGWRLEPRRSAREQLQIIKKLLAEASEVIHAGDPDREGQLLVDEVLQFCNNRLPVQRLLINDLNLPAVRRAMQSLRSNEDFAGLSRSALARSRADWLYGINMTRAYTLLGRYSGYDAVLSVGRVQTPVLGLVVQRDEAIESFQASPYLKVQAKMSRSDDELFAWAQWLPDPKLAQMRGEDGSPLLDDEGRVRSEKLARQLSEKVEGSSGRVSYRQDEEKQLPAPLPLNLSALQILAAKSLGYSAKQVLDICQSLYEKHQLITYPRSDCRYLPESHFQDVNHVLDAVLTVVPQLQEQVQQADTLQKNRAWDDRKISAHHAIVPTARQMPDAAELSKEEQSIYELIARYYLVQFYPPCEEFHSTVLFDVAGEQFSLQGRECFKAGWKQVLESVSVNDDIHADENKKNRNDDAELLGKLGAWQQGDAVLCDSVEIKQRKTRPPARYTDASLMAAMTGIARYVDDPKIKKTLRETDGLGTEATRALIIDNLFKRGFLMKGNKNIFSTGIGRDLIHALPGKAARPDMTALWEAALADIANNEADDKAFIQNLTAELEVLIADAKQQQHLVLTSADEVLGLATEQKHLCPACQSVLVLREGKNGKFWGCSRYPACKTTVPNLHTGSGGQQKDEPDFIAQQGGAKQTSKQASKQMVLDKLCPDCNKPLVKRKGKFGVFAGCSAYPACTHTEPLLQDDLLGED